MYHLKPPNAAEHRSIISELYDILNLSHTYTIVYRKYSDRKEILVFVGNIHFGVMRTQKKGLSRTFLSVWPQWFLSVFVAHIFIILLKSRM